ncbi:MAG: hypothetical protein RL745_517, partial [Actinomycetota bacterium]
MDIIGSLDELAAIATWVLTLDGTRDYTHVVAEHPQHRPLLHALIDAGCVIALADGTPTATNRPHTAAANTSVSRAVIPSADCLRQSSARVADDLSDDASEVAVGRASATVSVVGSLSLVTRIEQLIMAAGVTIADAPLMHAHLRSSPAAPSDARARGIAVPPPAVAAIIATVSDSNDPHLAVTKTEAYMRDGIAHMCISVAGSRLLCGPWVIPGLTACTRCAVLAEARSTGIHSPRALGQVAIRAQAADSSLVLAAAIASSRALAYIDGLAPHGIPELVRWNGVGSFESSTLDAHPTCGCTRALAPLGPRTQPCEGEAQQSQDAAETLGRKGEGRPWADSVKDSAARVAAT